MSNENVFIFDSTLRDGAQGEGINFSVSDKLAIVRQLDTLGVSYIEAGNPSSNPKDLQFFQAAQTLSLKHASLVAFGATRRRGITVQEDPGCQALLASGVKTVCIFGKSWDMQVTDVLHTTLEENLRMVAETIRYFTKQGRRVFFDAEHFFDGYRTNRDYALSVVLAAVQAGADTIILCDTNGAALPGDITPVVSQVRAALPPQVPLGIHCHNDVGCAAANTILAVQAGARHVQGTFLGFGERCGNANLSTLIPDLQIKLPYSCIPQENLPLLTKTAKVLAEITNIHLDHKMPFVGKSAFTHKGGMHVDGISKTTASFEHISPAQVGNHRNILLSEMSGRSAIAMKMNALDDSITRDSPQAVSFAEKLKEMEYHGYQFESAQASLELRMLKHLGRFSPYFTLLYFKVLGEQPAPRTDRSCSAMVKVKVGDSIEMTAAEGDGPVNALDIALRRALEVFFPALKYVRLVDYKVRVLDGAATAARVRVLIESTDGERSWTTVGVSTDIIEASWMALADSIEYKLLRDDKVLNS